MSAHQHRRAVTAAPGLAHFSAFRLVRAEGVGFEPTVRLAPHSGFQDRRHRPLGEPSLPRTRPGPRPPWAAWSAASPQLQATGYGEQPGRSSLSYLAVAGALPWCAQTVPVG